MTPIASVVITTRNRRDELRRALQSVMNQNGTYDVLVVDDASTDGTAEMVSRKFPSVRLDVSPRPLGLIVQRNRAAEMVKTTIIVSIDDDAILTTPNVLAQTISFFDHPRVGAVTIPFVNVGDSADALDQAPSRDGVWVGAAYTGTAHALRRELFQRLGGYRGYLFHYGEERDYCIRMLGAGYITRLGAGDLLHHCVSKQRVRSRGYIYLGRNTLLFPWYNTPMSYLPFHLAAGTFNVMKMGIRRHHPLWAAWGVVRGLASCIHEFFRRQPVPVRAYQLSRELARRPKRLEEIENRLEAMRFGPLTSSNDAQPSGASQAFPAVAANFGDINRNSPLPMSIDAKLQPGPRSIASMGNSGDISAWSGIPYFLFQAAHRTGFLANTLNLQDPYYRRHRRIWNLLAPLRLERLGGYQYSRGALEHMWQRVPEPLRHGEFISHFQLFPPLHRARASGAQHSFYIDATLAQLFSEGFLSNTIGRRTWADAIRRERELYHAAKFVVTMCRRTADVAVTEYGLDSAKVFIVRPGANMHESDVHSYLGQRGISWRRDPQPFTADRPARLGFIGRDFERKGLLRLVAAAEILHRRGRAVKVSIIGHHPPRLERHPLVEIAGFIDKGKEAAQFLEAVDRFALGCLPSYAEPLGISTLECLRLGVPVFGTDVGGIPDCVPPGAGFLVERNATPEQIAVAIDLHVFDPARYAAMVDAAERNMSLVTWEGAVRNLIRVWEGGAPHFPEPVEPHAVVSGSDNPAPT